MRDAGRGSVWLCVLICTEYMKTKTSSEPPEPDLISALVVCSARGPDFVLSVSLDSEASALSAG